MIYENIIPGLKKLAHFMMRCRVYIGRCPKDTDAPALIFFPVFCCRLNCGFAGLMTIHTRLSATETTADLKLAALWKKIRRQEEKNAEGIAAGEDVINAMTTALSELKQESVQEFLFFHNDRTSDLSCLATDMKRFIADKEKTLEDRAAFIGSAELESINNRTVALKDICWTLEKDVADNLRKVLALTDEKDVSAVGPAAFRKYRKLNLALNALDRLEVRGRDSAGIQLTFTLKDRSRMQAAILKLKEKGLYDEYERRTQKGDLVNGSISVPSNSCGSGADACMTFTYKTFSIVGELGRNVSALRNTIKHDRILKCFADMETSYEQVLTHTRWASVGTITEENCHPLNNHAINSTASHFPMYPGADAYIHVVLNGDVDNYATLRQSLEDRGEMIAPRITTDTKIIPLQIEKYLTSGEDLANAFRLAVNDFKGSHAIAMTSNLEPDKMFLALKGSGQSIYLGISEDQYMFSSEVYGLVEVMPRFLKMDGEEGGQIFVLTHKGLPGVRGVTACSYDGRILNLTDSALQTAEITTRDIDRGEHAHYFLKEISQSSLSVRRTLRGKYLITAEDRSPSRVRFNLGEDIVPEKIRNGLKNGRIRNIMTIGHGTAAVAGQAVADALSGSVEGKALTISARIASELSGFGLKDDLTDTLIIPITQSGTTTDTNRAVAMARERGAHVISIVNRRQSDITAKSDGVFYTSDGRDIEMSVASSKAFYAQIVAGQLLALFFAQLLKTRTDDDIAAQLRHLESAPRLMDGIFSSRRIIAASVKSAIRKRHWAVAGSGPNKAAADEIRIKLSELCYKTISADIIENKKHIDLSAEPFILVCASGCPESVVSDIVKDVAIFKAHQAMVIVFADDGDCRFHDAADAVIALPAAPSPLPVILNTMAGHLWGYYAACAIDEEARVFREFRGRLGAALMQIPPEHLSDVDLTRDVALRRTINDFFSTFNAHRQNGAFGFLGGKTLSDLTLLLKYASGKLPLQDFRYDFGNEKETFSLFDLLDVTLGTVIDELSRPIDAIRHQAKTVTVGTSRKEIEPEGILFDLLKTLEYRTGNLTHRDLLMLRRVQPAIASIEGYTVYDITGIDLQGNPTPDTLIAVRVKRGIAAAMTSRADHPSTLRGVKRTIVSTGHAYLGKGKTDNAPILIIPIRKRENGIANLLLIHLRFNEQLTLQEKISALGYRYNDIRNLVDEYNLTWDDRLLESFSLESLFSEPIDVIAGRIKSEIVSSE